jgi:hypothetical protein
MHARLDMSKMGRFRFEHTAEDLATYRKWRNGMFLVYGCVIALAVAVAMGREALVANSTAADLASSAHHAIFLTASPAHDAP